VFSKKDPNNDLCQLILVFSILIIFLFSFKLFSINLNENNLIIIGKIIIFIIFLCMQLKLDIVLLHFSLIFIIQLFFCHQECIYEYHLTQVAYYCEVLPLHTMETIETGIRHQVELANCDTLKHLFFENVRVQARMDSEYQLSFAKLCLSDNEWLDTYLKMNVPVEYQADVKAVLTRNCYCFHINRELNRFINMFRPQL